MLPSIEKYTEFIKFSLFFMTINYQFTDIIHLFFRFRKPFSINNH